jgi:hypothetical protein
VLRSKIMLKYGEQNSSGATMLICQYRLKETTLPENPSFVLHWIIQDHDIARASRDICRVDT